MLKIYQTPEEAKNDKEYLEGLTELLLQLADDDLLMSHRGSEWIGLAPHIEEDVAYASIAQNTLGHAVMFYQLLEELGLGKQDDLAYLRQTSDYRNAILTERLNGEGHYMESPQYDWAYTVIRNYCYEVFKKYRLDWLARSSYQPLADISIKIQQEQYYHLFHWEVWIDQLSQSTNEARERLNQAIERVWRDIPSLLDRGPKGSLLEKDHFRISEQEMNKAYYDRLKEKFRRVGLQWLGEPKPIAFTGREGKHTDELVAALQDLSEVYRLDPQASW